MGHGSCSTPGMVDPDHFPFDDEFWRESFPGSSYASPERSYEYYQPAYRFGWESYSRYGRRSFQEIDEELQQEWESHRDPDGPGWPEARGAARDAWDRAARHEPPRG
jgi:hypothetical protein